MIDPEFLQRKAHWTSVLALGVLILAGLFAAQFWARRQNLRLWSDLKALRASREQAVEDTSELRSLRDLKAKDVWKLKAGLSHLAQSKRSLYEAGLALQEEKRLLEKQQEIMTTWLQVDLQDRKIRIMRGDLAVQEFSISYSSPMGFGGDRRPVPTITQIVSKERFANPERGKLEEKDGVLQWVPPQVGTSVRANALGEYVVFTNSGLILHGPPRRKVEHEAFPHLCLGLSLPAARKLYFNTFIGTRLVIKKPGPAPRPRR